MLMHLVSQLDKATPSWDLQLQLLQAALAVLVTWVQIQKFFSHRRHVAIDEQVVHTETAMLCCSNALLCRSQGCLCGP
jgi:hypothetical protein